MLVSCLEHIADEWKNVNMLLQIETNLITYVPGVHTDRPAHLGSLIKVYTVCKHNLCSIVTSIDPADAQSNLSVSCSHMP